MAVDDRVQEKAARARRLRSQGSLFEDEVDLDAVRASLGTEGCFRLAMEVREGMLRRSRLYRELPLDVFDRAAEREIEDRLVRLGHERGLLMIPTARGSTSDNLYYEIDVSPIRSSSVG